MATAPVLAGQERAVTLETAIAQAQRSSPDVLAAAARAEAADNGRRAAAAFRLPTVGLEAGAIRSDDPVAAFGGRLRQGRFAQPDFDVNRLNDPGPLTDWGGALGASWAPVDPAASAALRAADAEAEAARLGAEWTRHAAGYRAEVRYLQAVGAQARLGAAAAAVQAAEANVDLVARRAAEGMLTDADVLQARAALEAARARSIDVRRDVDDARGRLAVAMAWEAGLVPVPADSTLGEAAPTVTGGLDSRPDLSASEQAVRAADARAREAGRARLPRLEGFARVATHSADALGSAQGDWTVGFRVRIPVFTGFALEASRRAATALRNAAERDHAQRTRQAQAELAEATRAVEAAHQATAAAVAARDAAAEAARLMRRRFEEGLATTVELLGTEARAAELRSAAVDARLHVRLAGARLAFLTYSSQQDLSGEMQR